MKTSRFALAPLLAMATPALAHPGAHAHPHGSEPWIVAMGLALIAVAAVIMWRRK
ncbi:LPXTG cell wall anchor domain-containing protein [Tateyamaria omphalii]|uniref:LPXTG cell wall anchor domain-containing protein n=1 Tax=Tateyamaria omphalii TaxID=299262 RepID=UPI001C9978CC|nr:LPXTG cell wall anchor domain-containing protein [Tateyamaria omphalii]MBY5931775.1 LPXTG cell wall anchor domain-containing protein [Tateyamaria omphalii]